MAISADDLPGFDPAKVRLYEGKLPMEPGFYGLSKASDPATRKAVYRNIMHAKIFDLEDSVQLAEYERVLQLIADQQASLIDQTSSMHPVTGKFRALLHWAEPVLMPPNADSREIVRSEGEDAGIIAEEPSVEMPTVMPRMNIHCDDQDPFGEPQGDVPGDSAPLTAAELSTKAERELERALGPQGDQA